MASGELWSLQGWVTRRLVRKEYINRALGTSIRRMIISEEIEVIKGQT